MCKCACFANMSCQRLSVVSTFVSSVLFCNGIIVEPMIIKLTLARLVPVVILDPNLLKL
jgi:hypothetical protein